WHFSGYAIYPSPKSIYEILFGNEALDVEGRSRQASQPHLGAWASQLIFRGPTVRQVPMDSLPDTGNSKLSMSEECPALMIDPSRKSRKQRAYMSSHQAASLADSSTPAFNMIFVISQASTMDSEDAAPNAISFKNCSTLPGGLINGVASRIWGNKFELTATLSAYVAQQVLHSAQYSPKQRYFEWTEVGKGKQGRGHGLKH
ncbi:LOW QUALITY PROTEIN: hypothetical protein HID58_002514, partial [Brassica napus]